MTDVITKTAPIKLMDNPVVVDYSGTNVVLQIEADDLRQQVIEKRARIEVDKTFPKCDYLESPNNHQQKVEAYKLKFNEACGRIGAEMTSKEPKVAQTEDQKDASKAAADKETALKALIKKFNTELSGTGTTEDVSNRNTKLEASLNKVSYTRE